MKTISLVRSSLGPAWTAGVMTCPSVNENIADLVFATLELPWKGNQKGVSCVPAGTYPVQYAWSDRWNRLMPHVLDVPFRDLIELHIGNFPRDTDGCVLVGSVATDIGIGSSTAAFVRFDAWLGRASVDHVQIVIEDPTPPLTVAAAA